MNIYLVISEHANATEVIAAYTNQADAEADAEMYQRGSDEAGNNVEVYVDSHILRSTRIVTM